MSVWFHGRQVVRGFLAIGGTVLLSGQCYSQWTTYQADTQHTGRSSVNVNPMNLAFQWQAPQGYSVPLIVGNSIYSMRNQQGVGGDITSIRSFDLASGSANWTYSENYTFPSQPTYQGGDVVYVAKASGTSRLYVLNSATGGVRYTVPLTVDVATSGMPVVHQDGNGIRRAYVVTNSVVTAVQLGANSGSVAWSTAGNFSPGPIPTILGNSVLVAGPGKFFAYDLQTGVSNQFHNGNISGGGSATVVADATNNRFYVLESYSTSALSNTLTAYSYVNNSTITQLWQRTDAAIGNGGNVAVGPDGKLYVANNTTLSELDPTSGGTLRFLPGQSFPNGVAPILSNGYLWIYETTPSFNDGVSVFDLNTFTQTTFFTGGRGSLNSTYDGPGALANNTFALDYGNIYGQQGFRVFIAAVPEPTTIALGGVVICGAAYTFWTRARRRSKLLDVIVENDPG